ncbi:pyruvate formate lyase activating enzyme [Micrococcales bacterium KH10]|nr:pyruvate formate lyase activating enzyme [Micrococcales bacterium KH10]
MTETSYGARDGSSILLGIGRGPLDKDDAAESRRDQDFEAPQARTMGAGTTGLASVEVEHRDKLAMMRDGTLGSIHSWELVTAVDGPGTRMTVFMAGCPLRCLYCHNPDTFKMKDGEAVTSEVLLNKIRRYRGVFKATGGGLTISGGEVLMQPRFAATILKGAHDMGIHTCIDTSGYLGANCTDEMLDTIDLVLLDVKSGDPETYKKTTGRDLQPTIDFGDRLAARGIEVWARFVLVPGLTDDFDNVEKVADIVSRWPDNVSRVEVLPFHQMGRDKWDALGYAYELEETQPPSPELVERVREQFRSRGFTVK